MKLVSIAPGRVSLSASDPGQLAYARQRSEQIAELFKQAMGKAVKVSLKSDAETPARAPDSAQDREALEHPLVKQAIDLFNARVVSVERDATQDPSPHD